MPEGIEVQPLTGDLSQEKKEMACKIEIGGELVEFKSTKELFHNEFCGTNLIFNSLSDVQYSDTKRYLELKIKQSMQ